jgi:hypothetical protein
VSFLFSRIGLLSSLGGLHGRRFWRSDHSEIWGYSGGE